MAHGIGAARLALAMLLAGACSGAGAATDADAADAAVASDEGKREDDEAGWHGGAWVVSNYDFRGVTQSQEDAVGQGELYFQARNGFYAGVWGSAVDYTSDGDEDDGVDFEFDPYIGWTGAIAERWSVDVLLIRQIYPTSVDDVDYDYDELEAKLWLDDTWFAHVGYSNDVFNFGESGVYTSVGVEWAIGDSPCTFVASGGWYALDDAAGDSYGDWKIGVEGEHRAFVWKLEYVDTVSYGDALVEAIGEPSEGEVIATIGIEF